MDYRYLATDAMNINELQTLKQKNFYSLPISSMPYSNVQLGQLQPIRFRRLVVSLTLGLLTALSVSAQRTQSHAEPDYHYRNGLELFERANYAAARYEFRQYLEPRRGDGSHTLLNTGDQNAIEAEYYIALASLYIDEPGAELLVDRFVKNHSQHPKAGQLYGDLGTYYYTRQDYAKAIDFLAKAVAQGGSSTQQMTYKYQLGLSYYNTQNLQQALPLLNEVKLKQIQSSSGCLLLRWGH